MLHSETEYMHLFSQSRNASPNGEALRDDPSKGCAENCFFGDVIFQQLMDKMLFSSE